MPLVEGVNLPNGRSVEHLIPNAAITFPRTKRDGDFFACRKCNSRKGHIDFVLGTLAKSQSRNDEAAANSLMAAVTRGDKQASRFIEMVATAVVTPFGVLSDMPISGRELLEYVSYLGRGQYFRIRGRPFDESSQVMVVGFYNKELLQGFEQSYELQHLANPFLDLQKNKYAETYSQGDCIIYSKNTTFMFLFHDYIAITVEIKRRNRKNAERSHMSAEFLLKNFRRGA